MADIDKIRKSAGVAPIFPVTDLESAFEFYLNVLEFKKQWDWGEPASFGCVTFGDVELFLCLNGQGTPGTWMYLFVDELEEYRDSIQQRGGNIIQDIVEESWGMKEMLVQDPSGNIIRIGTSTKSCD